MYTCAVGTQVWSYAHGTDDRQVEPPKSRKSVGAECNWGIRFQNDADALAFMDDLAGELSTRMKGVRSDIIYSGVIMFLCCYIVNCQKRI